MVLSKLHTVTIVEEFVRFLTWRIGQCCKIYCYNISQCLLSGRSSRKYFSCLKFWSLTLPILTFLISSLCSFSSLLSQSFVCMHLSAVRLFLFFNRDNRLLFAPLRANIFFNFTSQLHLFLFYFLHDYIVWTALIISSFSKQAYTRNLFS